MSREWRVFGPPGTGKTTYAAQQIANAARKYGPDRVLVSSFTRAAAAEIASRDLELSRHSVGTLHSICWHALDRPVIAETKIDEFNAQHPIYKLSANGADLDDLGDYGESKTSGDELMKLYQISRARMVPQATWSNRLLGFSSMWEGWKKANGYLDFNDLISHGADLAAAPGNPAVGFIDEAQDLSTLQMALVRKWAARMESVVFLGDDDQSIYGFAGADPRNLIADDLPADRVRVLSKSYRLPEAVHRCAATWILRCRQRQPKEFLARDAPGEVASSRGSWRDIGPVVDDIERRLGSSQETDGGRAPTFMILASCSYMLPPIVEELRHRGIPFHNPFRRTRGDWNPLRRAEGSIQNRVRCYWHGASMNPPVWTAHQMKMWMDLIRTNGVLKRGVKSFVEGVAKTNPAAAFDVNEYHNFFEGGCPFEYEPATLDWLRNAALDAKRKQIGYPISIIEKRGLKAMDEPRVIVGTIHSVKGGQADHVYLFPDISTQASGQWDMGGEGQDSVRRTFYVGMTRAYERLIICEPATRLYLTLPRK